MQARIKGKLNVERCIPNSHQKIHYLTSAYVLDIKKIKRFLVEIYNDWCEEFGSDKLCVNDVFFVKEFKKLYIFLNSLEILPEYKRVEIFNFLDYCAEINGINIEEIIS